MKTLAAIFLATSVLFAAGCYMADEAEPTTDTTEAEVVHVSADEAFMSISDQLDAPVMGAEDEEITTAGPGGATVGQACSSSNDCSYNEQCIGSQCRCECDYGAFCTSRVQCGFAGFCQNNRCNCF